MSEISQARINDAAMVAHEANRAFCLTIGDSSQPDWKGAENWQRESAMAGAEAIAKDPSTTPEQSHEQWSAHKIAEGWVYGPVKDPVAKTHPCLVPYDQLPEEQQRKDALFGGVVRAVLGLPQIADATGALQRTLAAEVAKLRAEMAAEAKDLESHEAFLSRVQSGEIAKFPDAPIDPTIPVPAAEPTSSEGPES